MIFWIIVGIAVTVTLYLTVRNGREYGSADGFLTLLVSLMVSTVVVGVSLGAVFFVNYNLGATGQVTNTRELQALGTTTGVEGQFFLGSGFIGSKPVISYIYKMDNGAKVLAHANASSSQVFEEDGKTPEVKLIWSEFDRPWLVPNTPTKFDRYEFVVPQGSVSNNYTMEP